MAVTLVVASLLVGAGLMCLILARLPHLGGIHSVFREPPNPRHLVALAALILAIGGWTSFVFWEGTTYAAFDCTGVHRLSESLVSLDLTARTFVGAVVQLTEDVD